MMNALKSVSPAWWGAIAGAVVAGATILPDARIVGGIGAGIAMFVLARKMSAPCCAGCADSASRSPVAQDSPAPPLDPGGVHPEPGAPCCAGLELLS